MRREKSESTFEEQFGKHFKVFIYFLNSVHDQMSHIKWNRGINCILNIWMLDTYESGKRDEKEVNEICYVLRYM